MDITMTRQSLQAFKADFFRALAHPVRIRILETLAGGERTVQELQQRLDLGQPIVSQQLAILRAKNIVVARKLGTTVHYALGDPLVARLLTVARDIFNNHLVNSQSMLRELQRERRK
jgi:DNA-binding transcriptional ArsR family regulator